MFIDATLDWFTKIVRYEIRVFDSLKSFIE